MAIHLFNRLETLDRLISIKSTGKPSCLAKRLGISERALYDFLDLMRDLGAPICYCKIRGSYYYKEPGRFHMRFNKFCLHPDDELIENAGQKSPEYMEQELPGK